MSKMNWTFGTILGVALLCGAAPQVSAQQLHMGTFKLPVAAQFGDVVLQPGDYDVSRVEGMSAIRIRGDGGTATILATCVDSEPQFDRNRMTLVSVNGTFELKRFDWGPVGKRYDFELHKKTSIKNAERASAGPVAPIEIAFR